MEHRQGGRGTGLTREREAAHVLPFFRRRHARAACGLILAAICVAACARHPSDPRPEAVADAPSPSVRELPRAHPAYLQWLERQSMLGAVPELSARISGGGLIWSAPAGDVRPELLLRAAPTWLHVTPSAVSSSRPALQELTRPEFVRLLERLGMGGLYLAPIGETAAAWTVRPDPDGDPDAVTGFLPAESLGTEEDFARLAGLMEDAGIQMGGDLPPAAGGMGPDFILQARKAPRFEGIYAMIGIPRALWNHLPDVPENCDGVPLSREALAALREAGALPPDLAQDRRDGGTPCGWAVTGEIRGADGEVRRHAYRWHGNPGRPVLLWQDPSGQARRIFSAAVIRHTGLRGQSLAGLRMEALMGLDRPSTPPALREALSPGDEAVATLGREIHRYGGWAMQADPLPPDLLPAMLSGGADFARDTLTEPAAERALLTGNAAPLAAALRRGIQSGLDFRRLARGLDGGLRVRRLLAGTTHGDALPAEIRRHIGPAEAEADPPLSPAALAALAMGRDPMDFAASGRFGGPDEAGRRKFQDLRDTALLLLGIKAALPGPLFVSPQELEGAIITPRSPMNRRVALTGPPAAADAVAAPTAFGPLEAQLDDPESFASLAALLLKARAGAGLAHGRLLAAEGDARGCLALATALPGGGCWLAFANVSSADAEVRLRSPVAVRGARDALTGLPADLGADERAPKLFLKARHIRHVLIGPADKSAQGDQA